jgi:hypothetical protein
MLLSARGHTDQEVAASWRFRQQVVKTIQETARIASP